MSTSSSPDKQRRKSVTASHQPLLTRDLLRKKNRLDLLLHNPLVARTNRLSRRRSVSNGNLFRRANNENDQSAFDTDTEISVAPSSATHPKVTKLAVSTPTSALLEDREHCLVRDHIDSSYARSSAESDILPSSKQSHFAPFCERIQEHNWDERSSISKKGAFTRKIYNPSQLRQDVESRLESFYILKGSVSIARRVIGSRSCELTSNHVPIKDILAMSSCKQTVGEHYFQDNSEARRYLPPENFKGILDNFFIPDITLTMQSAQALRKVLRRLKGRLMRSQHIELNSPRSERNENLPDSVTANRNETCFRQHSTNQEGPSASTSPRGHREDYDLRTSSIHLQFEGRSLLCFSPTSKVRLHLWKLLGSKWFDPVILVLLVIEWITMSFKPIRSFHDNSFYSILLIINVIFTIESAIKIIVYGFVVSRRPLVKPRFQGVIYYFGRLFRPNYSNSNEENSESSWSSQNDLEYRNQDLPAFSSSQLSPGNDQDGDIQGSGLSPVISHGKSPMPTPNFLYCPPVSPALSKSPTCNSHFSKLPPPLVPTSPPSSFLQEPLAEPTVSTPALIKSTEGALYIPGHLNHLKIRHCAYLGNIGNALDLVSVLSFWILFVMSIFSDRPWSLFLALAAIRVFRLLLMTEGTQAIMRSLKLSLDMLYSIMGLFTFFWFIFSLAGLFIFTNAFSRQCAIMPKDGVYDLKNLVLVSPRTSCNSYYDQYGKKLGVFDIDSGESVHMHSVDGFTCKTGQVCIQSIKNQPGWTYISYSNIWYSLLTTFTVISTEGWTDLLYMSQDSTSELGASVYYCLCIYLMTFIMVPMFIAVITAAFSHVRGNMRQSAFVSERKQHWPPDPSIITKASREKISKDWMGADFDPKTFYKDNHHLTVWKQRAMNLIKTPWFPCIGNILVASNLIEMMLYSAHMSVDNKQFLVSIQHAFSAIFLVEIGLRFYGTSTWRRFFNQNRNRLDLLIALGTAVNEIFVYQMNERLYQYFQIFAIMRAYRVVHLFPGVQQLVSNVVGDGQGLLNLTFFTFLVLSLFCPIAVQMFGGDYNDTAAVTEPVMRFDNFYQAFLALFQIMTGENWTDILYDAMHSQRHATIVYAAAFMVILYFAVHYIVLNLFIAVIVENLDLDDEQIRHVQIKKYIHQHRWMPEYFQMDLISKILLPVFTQQEQKRLSIPKFPQNLVASVTRSRFKEFIGENFMQSWSGTYPGHLINPLVRERESLLQSTADMEGNALGNISQHTVGNKSRRTNRKPLFKYGDEYDINVARENKAVILENLSVFKSLAILKHDNPIRACCICATQTQIFQHVMFFLTCVSVVLALWSDEPKRVLYPHISSVAEATQIVLLTAFWLEMMMYIIAGGLIMLPNSYLRHTLGMFNASILVSQAVSLCVFSGSQQWSVLRALRTLRVMTLIFHVEGMRVIFIEMMHGLPKMINAVMLNILVFVPFATYGSLIFSGRFIKCNDNTVAVYGDCHGEFTSYLQDSQHVLQPRVWQNPYQYSYDTFGKSLLHLFECASSEGWVMSLFSAMSVPPSLDAQAKFSWSSLTSVWHSVYYVVFMFVASLCSIQLFIGVFLEIYKQRTGISSLTNSQRQFKDLQRQLSLVRPSRKTIRPRDGTLRARCYELSSNKHGSFARLMTLVLMANIGIFASEHLHQTIWQGHLQVKLYQVFMGLYVLETFIKIVGLGVKKWASARWNLYDIVTALLVIVVGTQKTAMDTSYGLDITYKILLVSIAFRLAQKFETLNFLFRTIRKAAPSIFYVSTLFLFVMVCFAVVFQELFSGTRFGLYGNQHANFRSFWTTLLTLFRITTGENWDFLMHDFTVWVPNCDADCGSPFAAIVLFIAFYVVFTYIFVNLFTVVVINNFSFTFDKRNQFTLITRTDLKFFKEAWADFDTAATGYIQKRHLAPFLRRLKGILSIRIFNEEHSLRCLLQASKQGDANPCHLTSVPLSESEMILNSNANSNHGVKMYNFCAVNRQLDTMDVHAVQENRKIYIRIYQEIICLEQLRGIAFHDVLQTLALRLVDISKSLTFEELVSRSQRQDQIENIVENEKAKNLVNMLIQRRQFLKKRDEWRCENETNISFSDELVEVPSRETRSFGKNESLQPTIGHAQHREEKLNQELSVPSIVVDQPQPQHPVLQPLPQLAPDKAESTLERLQSFQTPAQFLSSSFSSLHLEGNPISSTKVGSPLKISTRDFRDRSPIHPNNTSPKNTSPLDLFAKYYVFGSVVDQMTDCDAVQLMNQMENNSWSEMLDDASEG